MQNILDFDNSFDADVNAISNALSGKRVVRMRGTWSDAHKIALFLVSHYPHEVERVVFLLDTVELPFYIQMNAVDGMDFRNRVEAMKKRPPLVYDLSDQAGAGDIITEYDRRKILAIPRQHRNSFFTVIPERGVPRGPGSLWAMQAEQRENALLFGQTSIILVGYNNHRFRHIGAQNLQSLPRPLLDLLLRTYIADRPRLL